MWEGPLLVGFFLKLVLEGPLLVFETCVGGSTISVFFLKLVLEGPLLVFFFLNLCWRFHY